MEKPIDHYMNLPYTIELRQDPEEGWFVRVKELRGCMSEGDTAEEAVAMVQEAMQLWLEVALEEGIPIPEPRPEEDYSGKFVVRVPRSLHHDLVEKADREGTSLNQTINVALARAVGQPVSEGSTPGEQPGWPGLKAAVHHALQAAGLSEEAGELDERLFANHMEQLIAQVESAIQAYYFRDALWALETIVHTLRPAAHMSPVLRAFLHTVALLSNQVEMVAKVQKGVMEEVILHSRITDLVQSSRVAGDVTRSISVEYSRASTELPREKTAEQLFSRPVSVPRW